MNAWSCTIRLALLGCLSAIPAGCDGDRPAPAAPAATAPGAAGAGPGGVAVLDLDRVAREMGWDQRLGQDVRDSEAALKRQFDERAAVLRKGVEEKKKLVAAAAGFTREQARDLAAVRDTRDLERLPLNAEQRQDLLNFLASSEHALAAARAEYQAAVQRRNFELVNSYRDVVRPVAKRIAADGGLAVVITPGDNLLYHDAAVDITDRVLAELKKSPPASSSETRPAAP